MVAGRSSRVPESVSEPDVAPGKDKFEVEAEAEAEIRAMGKLKGKGKGKAVEDKPHSPFLGFAAGICSG